MLPQYNNQYLNLYKKYRDILDVTMTIICKTVGSNEPTVFKIKAVPNIREFYDKMTNETNSEITFFLDELKTLISIDGTKNFPLGDIEKQVDKIIYNNTSYNVIKTRRNIFNNVVVFELNRKL